MTEEVEVTELPKGPTEAPVIETLQVDHLLENVEEEEVLVTRRIRGKLILTDGESQDNTRPTSEHPSDLHA